MASEGFQDSAIGWIIRAVNRQWFPYQEERYQSIALRYTSSEKRGQILATDSDLENSNNSLAGVTSRLQRLQSAILHDVQNGRLAASETFQVLHDIETLVHGAQQHECHPYHDAGLQQVDLVRIHSALERRVGALDPRPPILDDGTILVDWYSEDDPANPLNWPFAKKLLVLLTVCLNTFVVYMAAPIFSPAYEAFESEYGTSTAYTSLGLALYVLGYGYGPLVFSPLSEISAVGRNIPYFYSFIIFCVLCIPTALVRSAPAFMVLRFLQGVFGSPVLATGGASIADMFKPTALPHAMSSWVVPCYCAPAIGPIISGFAIPVLGWRFSMWEILIAAGPVMVLLFFLPETSAITILHRRASRLRSITERENIRSSAELAQADIKFGAVVLESLLTPIKISFQDPAVLFAHVYTSLTYGIYYSFFEAFPLVYGEIYGFNLGKSALPFLAVIVGCAISALFYHSYLEFWWIPRARSETALSPESQLLPALFASFAPPIGLFLFGWAARSTVHWIVPTIGIIIYPAGVFILMQCIFLYVPASYPQYAASLFAANDAFRCSFACGAVIFATPLYKNLGIGPGCSLLAGLTIVCAAALFLLYRFGAALRARSKFTSKW